MPHRPATVDTSLIAFIMAQPGRNDPCPCGSGQKYKRCCLAKDQQAERATLKAAAEARAAAAARHEHNPIGGDGCGRSADDDEDALTRDSNAIVDLVHEDRLDEAEKASREFLERYPQVHDGYDRLGLVYEARGDRKAAAHCYRKVIEFVKAHPDQYEPTFTATYEQMIDELDPPPAT